MEPEIREFFKRLSASIGLCVIWMAVNTTIGIKYGFAFYEDKIEWSNIVFYVWLVISFTAVVLIYIKLWKTPIEHLDD